MVITCISRVLPRLKTKAERVGVVWAGQTFGMKDQRKTSVEGIGGHSRENTDKEVWCVAVGEELSCVREVKYCHPFAALHSSITRFTSVFADSIDDDGTFVDRGPRGSGSFAVSLDALK